MSDQEGPIIKVNIKDGLKDLSKQIEDGLEKIEERLVVKRETKSLSVDIDEKPDVWKNYDWQSPIEEMLRDTRRNAGGITSGDYSLWRRDVKVDEIVTRHYDKETKETTYDLKLNESLVEYIGTIAQGTANCCIPELWADKIERDHVYPGSVFLGAWFVNWYTDIEDKEGDTVNVCRVAPAVCANLSCDEPATTAPEIACLPITMEHDVCAYAICKNDLQSVKYGLVPALNESLGSCLEVCVDNYFFNVALSCDNAGTLVSTGAMTGSLLLQAMGSMMAGTYQPVKVIMHPVPWISLQQDINFRYADHYGSRDVVSGGRLETAYGLEVNVTPKGTLLTGHHAPVGVGTYRTLLLAKGALAGALKHGITVETEYSPRFQKRWVLADIKYGGVCLHPDGIYWIHSVG